MQKILNKIIAILATITLTCTNIVPVMVYATQNVIQDAKTSEENVEFNATINNGYNSSLNVDEQGNLILNVKVSETGYLKESTVTLQNNNYEIAESNVKGVKNINDNVIVLDEVRAGESLNISLPIKIKAESKVNADILGRDSTITFNGIYVNKAGKERKIEKTLTEHLEWTADLAEEISQTLVRYIKYENSTILSFKIKDGIKDNKLPVTSKELVINVPTLEGTKPSNVIVSGDNISYKYENDLLTINKENKKDADGKIEWASNDEYVVTYIYDAQVEKAEVKVNINATAVVKENKIVGKLEDDTYELEETVGKYIEGESVLPEQINKGYIYTNLKNPNNSLETPYEVEYTANIGYKELTDSLRIVEKESYLGTLSANNFITNKKVKIEENNLLEILGEEGTIKVLAEDGKELGTLSKSNLELEVNDSKIILETSKIIKEGNLKVKISKVINSTLDFTQEQIRDINELKTNVSFEGYKEGKLNSEKEVINVSKLVEPTSNANLDIDVQNLSTVVKNEDVLITATLKTKDISDALYSNAKINITLPEEVKEINIKEAGLIYEDELVLNNLSTNGNIISFSLDGTQTKYSTQSTSEGTVIRLVADIDLDNLAPTSEELVTLDYTNGATGEENSVQDTVGIVAPVGFVTTNSLKIEGEEVTAQEKEDKLLKIKAKTAEKEAEISETIVNNLGTEATGVTIVGVIPSNGNKALNEIELNSNFDTILTSEIKVDGLNADIYYSENANETIDGTSWTNTYTQNAKAYKIVILDAVKHGAVINVSYNVRVPADIDYGKTSKAVYAVYYNNNAEQGNNRNVVLAKAVGITTGEIPVITADAKLIDVNTKQEIISGGDVKEGRILTYKLILKNTGKEKANVKVKITIPDGMALIKQVEDMTGVLIEQYDYGTKNIEKTIESIEPGTTQEIEQKVVVTQYITETEGEITEQKILAEISEEEAGQIVTSEKTVNVIKGDVAVSVTSNVTNGNIKVGDEIQYNVNIKNANYDEKNNIELKIKLPKELNVVSASDSEEIKYEYDEKTNTITYKISSLNGGAVEGILVIAKVVEEDSEKQISINATIKCDGMEEENLETINYKLIKNAVSATLTSNIEGNELSDTDQLEYYINVKNNSEQTQTINIEDNIPTNLRLIRYEIQDSEGTRKIETNSRKILASLQINKGETARLTIITEPYTLQTGRIAKIENKASITLDNNTFETNTLTHTIVGISESSAGSSTSPDGEEGKGNENTENEQIKEGTYKIEGSVWLDENENGKKDEQEQKMSDLTVKLYDRETGKIAIDANGKEQVKTTNNVGKYSFVNVVPGKYIVVIEYNSLEYSLAQYRVEGLSDAENSDFVSTNIEEKTVAATDEINVVDANNYNVDLGLVRGKVFDLDISKSISRITVTNTKADTRTYNYDELSVAKVELATANVDFATVLVEYTIKVTNNGQIAGYAKSIVDHIPDGMTFNSELNTTWYLGQDGNAYNTNLSNTLIQPGETKEVKLVLSRKMSGENTGTVRNSAEILISYNEYGLVDRDVGAGKVDSTEDKSAADVVIGMATGREVASYTGITLGVLAIIALAVYEIKKHIINKMYNNII